MGLPLPRLKPFLFDRDFGSLHNLLDGPPAAEESIAPAACFTEEELMRARAEGFAAGQAAAAADASRAAATRIALAMDSAVLQLQALAEQTQRDDAEVSRQAVAVALAVCRKVLPASYRETGAREITDLITALLPQLASQPALLLRVHGDLTDCVESALQPVLADAGLTGRLRVQGDAALAPGDCRIEWTGGGLSRSWADLWQAIEGLARDQFGIDADRLPKAADAGPDGYMPDLLTHAESTGERHG